MYGVNSRCAYSLAVLIYMKGSNKCPLYALMENPTSMWT